MKNILNLDCIYRGFLFFILAVAGLILFYHHHTNQQVEDVATHQLRDEVVEEEPDRAHREYLEHSEDIGRRRKSLSVVRSNLSTLKLPTRSNGYEDDVSPGWGEHNFYTPQPYKTPHPHPEDEKKLTFRSIPIFRT